MKPLQIELLEIIYEQNDLIIRMLQADFNDKGKTKCNRERQELVQRFNDVSLALDGLALRTRINDLMKQSEEK